MSLYPTKMPPITIKNMHKYWNLSNLWGKFITKAIIRIKKTMNFLNAIKAARGSIVTQYEERMLVVHMNIEYGMIIFIASLRKLVFMTVRKIMTLTIRWIMNAYWMVMNIYERVKVKAYGSEEESRVEGLTRGEDAVEQTNEKILMTDHCYVFWVYYLNQTN